MILLTKKTKPTLTFWFFVLIGGFFRTACKASIRFPVQGGLRMQHSTAGAYTTKQDQWSGSQAITRLWMTTSFWLHSDLSGHQLVFFFADDLRSVTTVSTFKSKMKTFCLFQADDFFLLSCACLRFRSAGWLWGPCRVGALSGKAHWVCL